MKYNVKKCAEDCGIEMNTTTSFSGASTIFTVFMEDSKDDYGDDVSVHSFELVKDMIDFAINLMNEVGEPYYNKKTKRFLGHKVSELLLDWVFNQI